VFPWTGEVGRRGWVGVGAEVDEVSVAAAVAAGGTVVDDSEAPSFTVLADPDGNTVRICTFLDRA